jgi:hypothetical protein
MFVKPHIKIKFLRDFVSPVFGNVWQTRELMCESSMAKKMIEAGLAEEIGKKHALDKSEEAPKPDITRIVDERPMKVTKKFTSKSKKEVDDGSDLV